MLPTIAGETTISSSEQPAAAISSPTAASAAHAEAAAAVLLGDVHAEVSRGSASASQSSSAGSPASTLLAHVVAAELPADAADRLAQHRLLVGREQVQRSGEASLTAIWAASYPDLVAPPILPGTENQPQARVALTAALASDDHLSHAYLFHGPPGTGKRTAARAFAAALIARGQPDPADVERRVLAGVHPDVTWVEPRGAHDILVDDVRTQGRARGRAAPVRGLASGSS